MLFPYIICSKGVHANSLAISCDVCDTDKWCHIKCDTGTARGVDVPQFV